MFRNLKKIRPFFLLLVFYSNYSCSGPAVSGVAPGSSQALIEEYLQIHQDYSRQFCSTGIEAKYQELLKDFRGEGYYVPVIENDKEEAHIDLNTLRMRLPLVQQKIAWLDDLVEKINKTEALPTFPSLTKKTEKLVSELLRLKKLYFHDHTSKEKKTHLAQSRKAYLELRKEFDELTKKIPFLLSFSFPVDYFEMRKEYEHYKGSKDPMSQHKANSVFLKRKILEDGAYELDNTRPDNTLRANLDTLHIRLHHEQDFLPEDIRYDLEYTFKQLAKFLALNKNAHQQRLIAWKIRAENEYAFYFKLLQDAQGNQKQQAETTALVTKRSVAKHILKDFILKREAEAWRFWAQKAEIHQAFFAMETILINEVGTLDTKDALERKDVSQVVINRRNIPSYSELTAKDSITSYLKDLGMEKIQKHPWLNVLFKEGEFSFTYFFIPASMRIFCSDQSPTGKFLQRENLGIALQMLRSPNYPFRAIRYFSRASMVGRIDMAPMWVGHDTFPERPGIEVSGQKVEAALKRGQYQYFYTFTDPEGKNFDVVEVNERTYVVSDGPVRKVYQYRNPHLFRYFVKKGQEIAQTVLFENLPTEVSPNL